MRPGRNAPPLRRSRLEHLVQLAEVGQGNLVAIDSILANDLVDWPLKLRALDAAIEHGLLRQSDLDRPAPPAPLRGPFGDDYRTLIDRILSTFDRALYGGRVVHALLLLALLVVFIALLAAGAHWGIALLSAFFVGPFAFGLAVAAFPLFVIAAVGLLSPVSLLKYIKRLKADARFREAKAAHALQSLRIEVWRRRNSIRAWESADGDQFEELVARWFRQRNYVVNKLGGAGDGGVDLIVSRSGQTAIVQCKAYSKPVPPAAVRELWGVLQHHGSERGYLATLHGVSTSAAQWISGKPIVVLDMKDFIG